MCVGCHCCLIVRRLWYVLWWFVVLFVCCVFLCVVSLFLSCSLFFVFVSVVLAFISLSYCFVWFLSGFLWYVLCGVVVVSRLLLLCAYRCGYLLSLALYVCGMCVGCHCCLIPC